MAPNESFVKDELGITLKEHLSRTAIVDFRAIIKNTLIAELTPFNVLGVPVEDIDYLPGTIHLTFVQRDGVREQLATNIALREHYEYIISRYGVKTDDD